MTADRVDADPQGLSDPGRRPTPTKEAQHLALASAEAGPIAQPAQAVLDDEADD
jgi:hypothetical protein